MFIVYADCKCKKITPRYLEIYILIRRYFNFFLPVYVELKEENKKLISISKDENRYKYQQLAVYFKHLQVGLNLISLYPITLRIYKTYFS